MVGLINAVPPEKVDEYKNVLVYLEHRDNHLARPALEMIGIGKTIAHKINEKLICALIGSDLSEMSKEAEEYGCDKIIGAESKDLKDFRTVPYAELLADTIREQKPNVCLIAATRNGRDLASRVAVRSQTGVTADCTEIDIEPETRILLAKRPTYGESTLAEILCRKHRPQMATARPGIFKIPEPNESNKAEMDIRKVEIRAELLNKEIVEFKPKKHLDLTSSDYIVAGGLGLGGSKGFDLLDNLAEELNGTVGATRPAVDLGWIERDHQVGQTGQTVRPRLYVAAGISGKIQHILGMKNSETIISINTDPNAEINNYSDYVVTADLYDAVPRIIEEIKKYKKEHPLK